MISEESGSAGVRTESSMELDEDGLVAWGRCLGEAAARSGVFVALEGPLGAGKSTLVRAACRGAGVRGRVPSPTYTLVNEYPLPDGRRIFHVDLYRIRERRELRDIGWERILAAAGPVFVEWADRIPGSLPADRWEVRLAMAGADRLRRVRVRAMGDAPELPAPGARIEGGRPAAGGGGGGDRRAARGDARPPAARLATPDGDAPERDGC